MRVTFEGEEGADEGGMATEMFRLFFAQASGAGSGGEEALQWGVIGLLS